MIRHIVTWLTAALVLCACTSESFLSKEGRVLYRSDVCGQYLSPESTTPNLAGRGRSCVQSEEVQ